MVTWFEEKGVSAVTPLSVVASLLCWVTHFEPNIVDNRLTI
jgi:hypothetical protein